MAEQLWGTLRRPQLCFLVFLATTTVLMFLSYYDSFGDLWNLRLHQSFLLSRHVQDYPILIRPRSCQSHGPITLLLALKSHTKNEARREAIRNTWGKNQTWAGRTVRRVFLLGLPLEEPDSHTDYVDAIIWKENSRYGDILQWHFKESFFNVTLKELLFWRWFQEDCTGSVQYVLKGDDDVFVNVDRVLGLVQHPPPLTEPLYVGHVFTDTYPVRIWWSKYYIPASMFSGPYPPYVGGGGYLISQETIRLLLQASSEVPLFPIDDAYVGMCAQVANISARHHQGFMPFEFTSSKHLCAYWGVLVLHSLKPSEQYLLWDFYNTQGHMCEAKETSSPDV